MAGKKWHSRTLTMPPNHSWTSRPGCKVLVLDRGAVRFDYPREWSVRPTSDCMELHDKPPPDDNCRLAVSYITLAPIDWSGLKLETLVEAAEPADTRPITGRGEMRTDKRGDLELAWRDARFNDPTEQREAISLMCIARKGRTQALITFDFWAADQERSFRIWTTVLRSLELDQRYDPRTGRVLKR